MKPFWFIVQCGARASRSRNDSGSAAVEFVLILVPLALLLQAILLVLVKGQVDAAAVSQATNLARVCALADADETALREASNSTTPRWTQVNILTCEKVGGFAKVRLQLSLRGFPTISREVTWHASLETPF